MRNSSFSVDLKYRIQFLIKGFKFKVINKFIWFFFIVPALILLGGGGGGAWLIHSWMVKMCYKGQFYMKSLKENENVK